MRVKSLEANSITSQGVIILFDTLRAKNLGFNVISLSFNDQIGDECMKFLGESIYYNEDLEVVKAGSGITDKGIKISQNFNQGLTDAHDPYLIEIASINMQETSIHDQKKGEIMSTTPILSKQREVPIKSNS